MSAPNETSASTTTPGAGATIANDTVVSFHYRLAEVLADGTHSAWQEQSHGGEPLLYLHGFHNVVVGLEKALTGKQVGAAISITLKPEEAYGPRQPDASNASRSSICSCQASRSHSVAAWPLCKPIRVRAR